MSLIKLLYSFLLVFLLIILIDSFWGNQGLQQIFFKNKTFMEKVAQITSIQKENRQLENDNNALRNSSFMIEKVAREEFGLAKPNEKLIILKPPAPISKTDNINKD